MKGSLKGAKGKRKHLASLDNVEPLTSNNQ